MSQLPLLPGRRASLTLYVYAAADFLCPAGRPGTDDHENGSVVSGGEAPTSLVSGGPSSLASTRRSASVSTRPSSARRTDSTLSIASSRSGSSIRSGTSSTQFTGHTSHGRSSVGAG